MGNLTPQAGENAFVITRDVKLGLIAATLKCHAEDLETALFAAPPNIGINIPEFGPRQINSRAAGTVSGFDVTVFFEGHPKPDAANEEAFELEGYTAQEAIETHWNIDVLMAVYAPGKKIGKDGRVPWPPTLPGPAGGKPISNPMKGVDDWVRPGLIWNHNFVAAEIPENLTAELGAISRTVPGNPPRLRGGNRVWILLRARARQRGNVWQIMKSWQLSGPGGEVQEMYPYVG